MEQVDHIINGATVASVGGRRFDSIDPYTREPWASVALGDAADADLAVAAAREAFDEGPWPRMSAKERATYLYRFADLLVANAAAISLCDTRDMGVPNGDGSGAGVVYHADHLRERAEHAKSDVASSYPTDANHHIYTDHAPAGVVAAITPWNFPVMMVISKLAPALAWGNTVVLKPAEQSPVSAAFIGRLALEAGLPDGVVNVVHGMGPNSVGGALVSSKYIDRVTFTGSTAAGAAIAAAAATNLVPATLECGGKGPNIIFGDADLEVAVKISAASVFSNTGQICVVGSRLFVHRSVFDDVVAALVAEAQNWTLGDPKDPATTLGPLASGEQFERVRGYLDLIPADGGEVLTGGLAGDGWFVRPTVVIGLKPASRVCREEIFGPIVTVTPFDDDLEVVAAANDTAYGLSASFFTRDFGRAHRVAGQLRAGTVWVNTFGVLDARAPFGGFKQSGLGREGGDYSRDFYTEARTVVMQF